MKYLIASVAAVCALALSGCEEKTAEVKTSAAAASPELQKVVVAGAPSKAPVGVSAAKKNVKTGEDVVMEGRVKDFVEGPSAIFTIADVGMQSCKDRGEKCETPWDYCCEDAKTISANTATVKVTGGGSEPLKGSVQGLNKIDHLSKVVVEGKAQKDDQGNLTVTAQKVYITQ